MRDVIAIVTSVIVTVVTVTIRQTVGRKIYNFCKRKPTSVELVPGRKFHSLEE